MKNMKFVTAAALVMGLSLSACSSEETRASDTGPSVAESPADVVATAGIPKVVTYEVEGDAPTAISISYMSLEDGHMETEQVDDAKLPFTAEVPVKKTGTFDVSSYSLTAQSDESGAVIGCKLMVDGEVIAEDTSTATDLIVTCTGY